MKRDSAKRDSAKRDSAKRDSAKRDSAKRDSAKRDSAKRDSAKRDRTAMKIANRQSLERTERMISRWMCGVSLKDRKRSVDLYSLLRVQSACD